MSRFRNCKITLALLPPVYLNPLVQYVAPKTKVEELFWTKSNLVGL